MGKSDLFSRLVTAQHLYFAAAIFGVLTFSIITIIYFFLYRKKKRHLTNIEITEVFNKWLSDILLEQEPDLNISDELGKYLKHRNNRHYIVESLINVRKNFTGKAIDNVIRLYESLGFKEDSIKKMNSVLWHEKARGIYELYMMNQRDEFPDMFRYTNSNNPYVRMEAQTAIIGFEGFKGLVFLDELIYPLHEWQQIKLLEQLNTLDTEAMHHLPLWLQSENKYVVQFALKLAEIYRQYQVHDLVIQCLQDSSEAIRAQAIKTLGKIALPETIELLKAGYTNETIENRKKIIQQIGINGGENELAFLTPQLDNTSAEIALEATRAIFKIKGTIGSAALVGVSERNALIYEQVKAEMNR